MSFQKKWKGNKAHFLFGFPTPRRLLEKKKRPKLVLTQQPKSYQNNKTRMKNMFPKNTSKIKKIKPRVIHKHKNFEKRVDGEIQ